MTYNYVNDVINNIFDIFEEKTSKKRQRRIDKFLKDHKYDSATSTIEIDDIDPDTGKKARVWFDPVGAQNELRIMVDDWDKRTSLTGVKDCKLSLKKKTLGGKARVSDFSFRHEEGHLLQARHMEKDDLHPIWDNGVECLKEIQQITVDVCEHEKSLGEYLADIYAVNKSPYGMNGLYSAMDDYINSVIRAEKRALYIVDKGILQQAWTTTVAPRKPIEDIIAKLHKILDNKTRKNRLLRMRTALNKLESLDDRKQKMLNKVNIALMEITLAEEQLKACEDAISKIISDRANIIKRHMSGIINNEIIQKQQRKINSANLRKERTGKYLKESVNDIVDKIFAEYESDNIGYYEAVSLIYSLSNKLIECENDKKKGLTFMEHSLVKDLMFIYGFESGDSNINDEIEPVVKALEKKGYNVKYSSPGYDETRFDNDRNDDGVINSKLVSTARIIFDSNHNFKVTPQCWEWKILKNGSKALYVKPYSYNLKTGTKKEAFIKWKERYMANLRSWVVDLPKAGTETKSAPADTNFDAS